jgi:RNA polymerase sigma factor (sigma-70 family)
MTNPETDQDRWEDRLLALRCSQVPVDDESWRGLWGRYKVLLEWRVKQTLPRALWGDAEDVVQEAFMRFHKGALGYDATKSSLGSYLVAIARNTAHDWEKRRRSERKKTIGLSDKVMNSEGAAGTGHLSPEFELDLDREALLRVARSQLSQIRKPRTRKVFEAYLADKTPQQVKDEYRVPQSTVYNLYAKYEAWLKQVAESLFAGSQTASGEKKQQE